ncbi:MAG: anhydro-N-acetylmuramic acid kinase [Flavobacteriaceae bacterium]|nr:anhydro-N-acetylmuramic acid kinase [Flavobacteriaceae bacterium]
MNKPTYIIALMSGTSLDGVDIAYMKFYSETKFELILSKTIEYDDVWLSKLKKSMNISSESLLELDSEYGLYLANLVNEFVSENDIKSVDIVSSHGHTVFHQPDKGFTLQIGNGAVLAANTGFKVICDFRSPDIALGGQGAPLVPIGDSLLYFDYDACLNIGGFANISYLKEGKRIAYDIVPVNTVLNFFSEKKGFKYDDRGEIAKSGCFNKALYENLNSLAYYNDKPSSLGLEYVISSVLPCIVGYDISIEDIMNTYIHHIVFQMSKIDVFKGGNDVLITGGGVFNDFLIDILKEKTKCKIIIPNDEIVNFKEAIVFGLLAYLKDKGENNCLASVTGASRDHSSGVVYDF